MAAAASATFGRLGSLAANIIFGLLIDSHCILLIIIFSSLLISTYQSFNGQKLLYRQPTNISQALHVITFSKCKLYFFLSKRPIVSCSSKWQRKRLGLTLPCICLPHTYTHTAFVSSKTILSYLHILFVHTQYIHGGCVDYT